MIARKVPIAPIRRLSCCIALVMRGSMAGYRNVSKPVHPAENLRQTQAVHRHCLFQALLRALASRLVMITVPRDEELPSV